MASRFVIMTAVPFHVARLQATVGKNILRNTTAEIIKNEKKDEKSSKPSRKRLRNISLQEKLHMRKLRNKTSAQVSRNRVKLQQDMLEQQLADLNYEKMKLLLENEALLKQNTKLEEENSNLKLRVENVNKSFRSGENSKMEAIFNHASFVSIPLQKEWMFSKIFFILMMSVLESLKVNFWIPCLMLQHSWNNSIHTLLHLSCLPWKLILPSSSYPQSLMIFNG